jgi:hypothetical protein
MFVKYNISNIPYARDAPVKKPQSRKSDVTLLYKVATILNNVISTPSKY